MKKMLIMSSLEAGSTETKTGRKVSEENQESPEDRDRKQSNHLLSQVNDKDMLFDGNEQE
jgi:hypothetical protein